MVPNGNKPEGTEENQAGKEEGHEFSYLENKMNIDRASIMEAIDQVGNDKAKVEEYLTNTRGL